MSVLDAVAQPLRTLLVIYTPVRRVPLDGYSVSVRGPAPGRYTTLNLFVAARRRENANGRLKADKDVA